MSLWYWNPKFVVPAYLCPLLFLLCCYLKNRDLKAGAQALAAELAEETTSTKNLLGGALDRIERGLGGGGPLRGVPWERGQEEVSSTPSGHYRELPGHPGSPGGGQTVESMYRIAV